MSVLKLQKSLKRILKNMKRSFDVLFSLIGFIILLPLILICALLIKLDSKGPVFFYSERVGKNKEAFKIIKLRTMNINNIGSKLTVNDDKRITRIGKILRKLKIDELPQLINVFIGNMSFVGPRPEVLHFVKHYPKDLDINKIFTVKPGITDYASIKYKNENEILQGKKNPEEYYIKNILPDKLTLNLKYIKQQTFFFGYFNNNKNSI